MVVLPEPVLPRRRARFLLNEALIGGGLRAGMFVIHLLERGRSPAGVLAEGVVRRRRMAAPPPEPAATEPSPSGQPATPRPAADPLDRQAQLVGRA